MKTRLLLFAFLGLFLFSCQSDTSENGAQVEGKKYREIPEAEVFEGSKISNDIRLQNFIPNLKISKSTAELIGRSARTIAKDKLKRNTETLVFITGEDSPLSRVHHAQNAFAALSKEPEAKETILWIKLDEEGNASYDFSHPDLGETEEEIMEEKIGASFP